MTRKTILTALCTLALTAAAVPSWAITTKEIADLGKAQVSDDIVITMIQSSDSIPVLNPQDVINMKAAGVSDGVIRFLLSNKEDRQEAFQYDQAIRRQILMNFQFPAGYFDNTLSGISHGYGGSLTPVRPTYVPYGANTSYGTGGGLIGGANYGLGYYPDYIRQTGPGGSELNVNLGGSNTGILYNDIDWDDLWTWNYALYGTPPADRLYFRQ
ncbi:MAG: hypothetical protein ABI743_06860 [bacterium]